MEKVEDTKTTVRLIGISDKYHVAPAYITPKFDEITREFIVGGKRYKGKTHSTEDNAPIIAEGTPVRVSDVDSYRIAHLQNFDPSNEVEMFLLQIAKDSGFVAENKAAINPAVHRYYIENKEEEAMVVVSKADRTYEAMGKIKSMSLEEMIDFGRLVGIYTKNMSKTLAESALVKMAQDKPDFILSSYNDKNKKVRTFLKKLVSAHIIRIQNGKYVYGNDLIGVNEDFTIEYLKDTTNNALISQWNSMLNKKEEPVTA